MKLRWHEHNSDDIEDEEGHYACDRDVNLLEYMRLRCVNDRMMYLLSSTSSTY